MHEVLFSQIMTKIINNGENVGSNVNVGTDENMKSPKLIVV